MAAKRSNVFRGEWRIVSTDTWLSQDLDLLGPAYMTFEAGGHGELQLVAISASIDYRIESRGGSPIVEFTWAGDDDGSPISGRGWAPRAPDGLVGRLFIHGGDEAKFTAKPFSETRKSRQEKRVNNPPGGSRHASR